ncbi:MAG TPA: hypothetical protein VMU14_17140 [Acidimicrobiales bacterium]|nr:hypothetical protein [Acidimicrobiales bacterium]
MTTIFERTPNPRIEERKVVGPPKIADVVPVVHGTGRAGRFNAWLAVKITSGVGTMWCAYAFAVIALLSLPTAVKSGNVGTLVSWVSQTFLQLVLLSIIIVGQNILGAAADKRSEATYEDADAVLHEAQEIQRHLAAQDAEIERLLGIVTGIAGAVGQK